MSFLGRIVLGQISGFIASKLVNKQARLVLTSSSAWWCGRRRLAVHHLRMSGVTGPNIYSMLVAIVGAVVVLIIYHAVTRRRV
jgi:uncharacterized membrane protein YeaQ/YmgE (transglycosylase-associated protein family)